MSGLALAVSQLSEELNPLPTTGDTSGKDISITVDVPPAVSIPEAGIVSITLASPTYKSLAVPTPATTPEVVAVPSTEGTPHQAPGAIVSEAVMQDEETEYLQKIVSVALEQQGEVLIDGPLHFQQGEEVNKVIEILSGASESTVLPVTHDSVTEVDSVLGNTNTIYVVSDPSQVEGSLLALAETKNTDSESS